MPRICYATTLLVYFLGPAAVESLSPGHAEATSRTKRQLPIPDTFAGGILHELTGRERIVNAYVNNLREEAKQVARITAVKQKR